MTKICVVGSYVQDLTFKTDKIPTVGETRIGTFKTGCGGKGFNQAVAANRQGIKTTFIGSIGDDLYGTAVEDFASKEPNLRSIFNKEPNNTTGVASIVVDKEGSNLITVALGANDDLSPSFIEMHNREIIDSDILICQLESNISATKKALEIAKSNRTNTLLNPAPINANLTLDLLKNVDIITPNESEFLYLLSVCGVEEPFNLFKPGGLNKILECCKLIPVETVIITVGEQGCIISSPKGCGLVGPLDSEVVDTTGAGDAFNGGLAVGLLKYDYDIVKAAQYANVVAGMSITKEGTAPSMPSLNDVKVALAVYGDNIGIKKMGEISGTSYR